MFVCLSITSRMTTFRLRRGTGQQGFAQREAARFQDSAEEYYVGLSAAFGRRPLASKFELKGLEFGFGRGRPKPIDRAR